MRRAATTALAALAAAGAVASPAAAADPLTGAPIAGTFAHPAIDPPPLLRWQARRVLYSYAIRQGQIGFTVDRCWRRTRHRIRCAVSEPGYIEDQGRERFRNDVYRAGWELWIVDRCATCGGRHVRWL